MPDPVTLRGRLSFGKGVTDNVAPPPARTDAAPVTRALRHRDFALFWSAALISNSAAWMQMVAVPAKMYRLTGSATWLGATALAMMVPSVVFTPLAGVLADRFSRRVILMITQVAQMAFAVGFFALYLAGALTPWRILLMLIGTGIVAGIQVPAWQSFVPTLVPRSALVDAVRLNSVQFQAARALGPGIGAAALGVFGFGAAFLINAVTFIPVVVVMGIVRTQQDLEVGRRDPVWRSLTEGFRFTLGHLALRRAVLAGFTLSALGQSLVALAAGIAAELYGGVSTDNAGLVAAIGAGSLVSGILVVTNGDRLARSTMAVLGLAIYLVGIALVPLTSSYTVGLIAFAVCGLAHVPVATSLNTFLQSSVPDRLRGRVVSCYLLGIMLGMPAGSMALGRLGDVIGLREALLINATAMAGFLAVVLTRFGRLRMIDADSLEGFDPAGAPVAQVQLAPSTAPGVANTRDATR